MRGRSSSSRSTTSSLVARCHLVGSSRRASRGPFGSARRVGTAGVFRPFGSSIESGRDSDVGLGPRLIVEVPHGHGPTATFLAARRKDGVARPPDPQHRRSRQAGIATRRGRAPSRRGCGRTAAGPSQGRARPEPCRTGLRRGEGLAPKGRAGNCRPRQRRDRQRPNAIPPQACANRRQGAG